MKRNLYNYTYEECEKIALEYNYMSNLEKGNGVVYHKILKNKWKESLCSHMTVKGSRILRLIYAFEFPESIEKGLNKSVYIGLSGDIERRQRQHTSGLEKSTVWDYIVKSGLEPNFILKTDLMDVNEASKMEGEILNEYK